MISWQKALALNCHSLCILSIHLNIMCIFFNCKGQKARSTDLCWNIEVQFMIATTVIYRNVSNYYYVPKTQRYSTIDLLKRFCSLFLLCVCKPICSLSKHHESSFSEAIIMIHWCFKGRLLRVFTTAKHREFADIQKWIEGWPVSA